MTDDELDETMARFMAIDVREIEDVRMTPEAYDMLGGTRPNWFQRYVLGYTHGRHVKALY